MENGPSKTNDQPTQQKKEKKVSYQSNKLRVPDIYEDQDLQSDNNSFESSQKQKKRKKKNNNKKHYNNLNQNSNTRKDKYGNEIIKGGKKHRIQFATKLLEVRVVENWKMYNQEDYESESQKSSCCLIL